MDEEIKRSSLVAVSIVGGALVLYLFWKLSITLLAIPVGLWMVCWLGVYAFADLVLIGFLAKKRAAGRVVGLMQSSRFYLGVLITLALVFPVVLAVFVGQAAGRMTLGPVALSLLGTLWLGFYSTVLLFLTGRCRMAATVLLMLNAGGFGVLCLLFLPGGAEIVPALLCKAVLPLGPNLWL